MGKKTKHREVQLEFPFCKEIDEGRTIGSLGDDYNHEGRYQEAMDEIADESAKEFHTIAKKYKISSDDKAKLFQAANQMSLM